MFSENYIIYFFYISIFIDVHFARRIQLFRKSKMEVSAMATMSPVILDCTADTHVLK